MMQRRTLDLLRQLLLRLYEEHHDKLTGTELDAISTVRHAVAEIEERTR